MFCVKAVHTISARQNRSDTATTRLAERITILLLTYIIGEIHIYNFWSFRKRYHQTCYTGSLSPSYLFLCKCYSAQLVKYFKQYTHTLTHTHQEKHSGIARHQHSSLCWSAREGRNEMMKMSCYSLL